MGSDPTLSILVDQYLHVYFSCEFSQAYCSFGSLYRAKNSSIAETFHRNLILTRLISVDSVVNHRHECCHSNHLDFFYFFDIFLFMKNEFINFCRNQLKYPFILDFQAYEV